MRVLLCLAMMTLPAAIWSPSVWADACGPRLIVDFEEGSPKDRFTLINASDPGWAVTAVDIDLGPSRGKLIFDITELGAGLSVYQPFEEAGGSAVVANRTDVTDGDSVVTIEFQRFASAERYAFTIDLDATLSGTPTVILWGEIEDAEIRARFLDSTGATAARDARFDDANRADTGRHETCFVS